MLSLNIPITPVPPPNLSTHVQDRNRRTEATKPFIKREAIKKNSNVYHKKIKSLKNIEYLKICKAFSKLEMIIQS